LLDVNTVLETGQYAPETKGGLEYFSAYPLDVAPDDREISCPTWPNDEKRNELLANAVAAMDSSNIDALIFPTWSNPPANIDRANEDYKGDNNQLLVPDAGLPAVTVPMGFWQNRLPAGLQFVGRPYTEGLLIELAYGYEQKTKHRRPPPGLDELQAELDETDK
jgi:amidase